MQYFLCAPPINATDNPLAFLGKISLKGTGLGVCGLDCKLKISKWVGSKRVNFQVAGEVPLEETTKLLDCPSKGILLPTAAFIAAHKCVDCLFNIKSVYCEMHSKKHVSLYSHFNFNLLLHVCFV